MEPNTKLIVVTVVLALTLTAAAGQSICGISYAGLISCQPYVRTKNPLTTTIDRKGPCCTAVSKANVPCFCKLRNSPLVSGINADLAAKLPTKCGFPAATC